MTNLQQPLVSVLMTAYNREKFIAEAIESVQAATYPNLELIIMDDSSKDRTAEIATEYAANDPRIRFYRNPKNLGDYPNRNKAAEKAKGKYIVFTDSDDVMFKTSLIEWVRLMEKKKADFGIFVADTFLEPQMFSAELTIKLHFFQKPVLMYGPGATIINRDYFNRIGGFPVKYGPANDMYYNLKAASQTATLFFPFPLVDYRRHEGQEINNKFSYLHNNYRYLRDALAELHLNLSQLERTYLCSKCKRRFVVNCLHYLLKSKDIKKTLHSIKMAQFGMKDLVQALYIKPLK